MTTVEELEITETPERAFLVREYAAELTPGDGRTVDVRIVPYGSPTTVDDGRGSYREEFVAGAFEGQLRAANRVLVNFEHHQGIQNIVGHGKALRDGPDGLYGSFGIHETADGDKTLMLVREGVLDGVSLEFLPKKSVRTAAGVVQRVKAHLRAIALCRSPAYEGASVLAVRESSIIDEELLPVAPDPELLERCRRLGLALPQRYQAHPSEADTSTSGVDTSDDGTRQPEDTSTTEEA